VKNATEFAKKFKTFRRKLPAAEVVEIDNGVIGELIYSHLLWNATFKQATIAYKKMISATVDLNDLRVNHVFETIDLIGSNYPQAHERAKRLRAVLNSVYQREHNVSVASLQSAGKRDIREYFDTLTGITPFVCNRVIALCYSVAAMPVDDRTLAALISNELVHDSAGIAEVSAWLVRQVNAADVTDVHIRLHSWASTLKFRPTKNSIKKESATKPRPKISVVKKKVSKKTTTKNKVSTRKKTTKKKTKK